MAFLVWFEENSTHRHVTTWAQLLQPIFSLLLTFNINNKITRAFAVLTRASGATGTNIFSYKGPCTWRAQGGGQQAGQPLAGLTAPLPPSMPSVVEPLTVCASVYVSLSAGSVSVESSARQSNPVAMYSNL